MLKRFRLLKIRALWRIKMLTAAMRIPVIAGADDDPDPEPKKDPKTFSQDEVNDIVERRLAKDRKDRLTEDEIKDLQDRAKRADELEREKQSEEEKLQADLATAQQERDQAQADAEAARAASRIADIRSAVTSAAAANDFDPEIAFALLTQRGFRVSDGDNNFEVTVADDGQVTGAEGAVKALAEQKGYVGSTPAGSGDGGARTSAPPKDLAQQIADAEGKGDMSTAMSMKTQQIAEKFVGRK